MKPLYKHKISKDRRKKWRWTLFARNGKKVACQGQGVVKRSHAVAMVMKLFGPVLALVLLVACAVTPGPIVSPQPGSVLVARTVAQTVTPASATCVLTPRGDRAVAALTASSGSHQAFTLPGELPEWGADVDCTADGYLPYHRFDTIPTTDTEWPAITLTEDAPSLPRLVPVGQYFRLEGGARWTWIGASDFNLLNRFRNGQDIEPILQQRQDAGFNAVRVFTVYDICADGNGCQSIGRSAPSPDLYAAIPGFAKALARHGLYGELVGFTGPYGLFSSDDAKVQHWESLIAAVDGIPNLTLELVNEGTHDANKDIPFARLRRPQPGIVASHGSGQQDELPIQPFWDYATYRPGAGPEAARKIAHNAMEDVGDRFGIATVSNETIRFPDSDNNPAHAFDAAAGAALLSGGAVFHSVGGKASVLWAGGELEDARAWASGARSVPLACQGQPYRRIDDPSFLRVYQRGNEPACIVRIRR